MTRALETILADPPPIASLDELYAVACGIGRKAARVYGRLAEEMESAHNAETAAAFEELAKRETIQILSICELADNVGANVDCELEHRWLEHDLRGDLAREIADNPYLLTPYRAFQLAAANKERVFEILSAIATGQDDNDIRQHAEALAHRLLSDVSELRLRRRRVSRSEIRTTIEKLNLPTQPIDMEQFNEVVQVIHAVIRTMTLVIRDTWASEMTEGAKQALQSLLDGFRDFSDTATSGQDRRTLEIKLAQDSNSLFSAIRALLRESEAAVDLFLRFAEEVNSEEIVHASQIKVERYVNRTAKIRDELNSILLAEKTKLNGS